LPVNYWTDRPFRNQDEQADHCVINGQVISPFRSKRLGPARMHHHVRPQAKVFPPQFQTSADICWTKFSTSNGRRGITDKGSTLPASFATSRLMITRSSSISLPQKLRAIAAAGFDGVESAMLDIIS
jgi:hypothetical protein